MTSPKNQSKKLHLSPSILHRYLMDHTEQTLGYTGGDVKAWQRKLRRKLRELLGMNQMPAERADLNVRSLWKRDHKYGAIEKIAFTSESHSDVTAYVCLPQNVEPPYTFFICLQGHSTGAHNSIAVNRDDNSRPIRVAGDRDFGIGCMKRGIAALCIEQRSFGERREQMQVMRSNTPCDEAAMHALMFGRTLMGERVYDVDRGIDYLATRSDVNMKQVGVMGNSGGGTISVFSAAVLPRIALAMPSCYFCTFRDSIMSIHHCVDNYVPSLLRYAEMSDVMGLFAPKPVVIVAGKDDEIFPVAAVRRSFRRLKAIYKAAGAENNCRLVVGPKGHRFYAELAWSKMLRQIKRP